jgi:hypothetical protein
VNKRRRSVSKRAAWNAHVDRQAKRSLEPLRKFATAAVKLYVCLHLLRIELRAASRHEAPGAWSEGVCRGRPVAR